MVFPHVQGADFLLLVGLAPHGRWADSEIPSAPKVRKKLQQIAPMVAKQGQNYSDPRSWIYREMSSKPMAVIITGLCLPPS